jgi:predicted ATP-dependent endonuclease of OLD family
MAIDFVEIKDFLMFKGEFKASFCPGVNVLIGGNGTGKTTLMRVLYRLCGSSKYMNTEEHFFSTGSSSVEFIRWPYEHLRMQASTRDSTSRICVKTLLLNFIDNYEDDADRIIINGEEVPYIHSEYKDDFTKSHALIKSYSQDELVFTSENYKAHPVVFIPSNDILSHSKGLVELADTYEVDFNASQIDILRYAQRPATRELTPNCARVINKIEEIIGGEVLFESGRFYVKKRSGQKVEFAVEASGFVRFSLLWKLLRNGLLEAGSVLLWDEPENSLNPELMPVLVGILLELSQNGVQIFIATHDYNLARYFDVRKDKQAPVMFHNLQKDGGGHITCGSFAEYIDIQNNLIETSSAQLFKAVVAHALEVPGDD